MDRDQYLASLHNLWRQEVEAATTCRLLGERESDPHRNDILRRMSEGGGTAGGAALERPHRGSNRARARS